MAEYATVDELYAEGVSPNVTEVMLLARIRRASALIEDYTRRWFYPKLCTYTVDGPGAHLLQLGPPIIAVTQVRVLDGANFVSGSEVPLTDIRVYNRHLTQNLTDPDDRNNPKLQYVHGRFAHWHSFNWGCFPKGVQNIEVTGLFGYTEFDDGVTLWEGDGVTPVGKVPDIIKQACMMLVVRDLLPLSDIEGRAEAASSNTIRQLKTRDQSITYGSSTKVSSSFSTGIMGNDELRAMLGPYCRLGELGSV